jgi:hypothetical protein
MSNAQRVATEIHTPATGAGLRARSIAAAAGLALLLVALGYVIGVRSSWTAHHPSAISGTAERVPANVPYAYFDPDKGGRVGFRLDDVVWKAGDKTDSGRIPPCLREAGERVAVQAGVIEVARPYGSGSYQQVLSVSCPD